MSAALDRFLENSVGVGAAFVPRGGQPDSRPMRLYALRGIPGGQGLGIIGDPNLKDKVAAGTYEITGTQVTLHEGAGTSSPPKGYFNNKYGPNDNKVVEPIDQVDTNGQVSLNIEGHNWIPVIVKSGELAGQAGYVATDYIASPGWTKAHGGTGPAPAIEPMPPKKVEPSLAKIEKKADYTIPIVLGVIAVAVAGGAGVAYYAKKQRTRAPAMAE